jgi:hypothetical protein
VYRFGYILGTLCAQHRGTVNRPWSELNTRRREGRRMRCTRHTTGSVFSQKYYRKPVRKVLRSPLTPRLCSTTHDRPSHASPHIYNRTSVHICSLPAPPRRLLRRCRCCRRRPRSSAATSRLKTNVPRQRICVLSEGTNDSLSLAAKSPGQDSVVQVVGSVRG